MNFSKSSSKELTRQFIASYLEGLDHPRALAVLIMFRENEHEQLARLTWNPLDYNTLKDARDSLAATSFLSKARFLKTGLDKEALAVEKFLLAEDHCYSTNRRIILESFSNDSTHAILNSARWKIQKILGNRPSVECLLDACSWGPGASSSFLRRDASIPEKFRRADEATPDLISFFSDIHKLAYPNWNVSWKPVRANKILTVHKNSLIDRVIAKEPDLNIWYQKGYGSLIRRKLMNLGIDLQHQSKNQELARKASLPGSNLATVDFSSASDTISFELVKYLLPRDWFLSLDACRTKYSVIDGKTRLLQKFSSMGNGFTFELESLIFYSIAYAICKYLDIPIDDLSIYGDDLILPSQAYDLAESVFGDLGFTINKKKSYTSSYFRESCGSFYWDGSDIKPYFLKEILNGRGQIYKAANSIRRLAHRRNYCGCDRALLSCWQLLRRILPDSPVISDGFGDYSFIGNMDECPQKYIRPAKHGYEGFFVRVWLQRPVMVFYDHNGLLLARLKEAGCPSDQDKGNLVAMPQRTMLVRKNLHIPRWVDLGPWL